MKKKLYSDSFNGAKFTDKGCTENLEQEALGEGRLKLKRVLSWRKEGELRTVGQGWGHRVWVPIQ